MKSIFYFLVAGIFVTSGAMAKGGGGKNEILTRGSQAWFVAESAEHLVRGLVATKVITEAELTRAEIAVTESTTATVSLRTNIGVVDDSCRMVDHWSKSNTVLKKEVRCQKGGHSADKFDLTRGTDAWAVVEGLEHSLRLAVTSDAAVLKSVTGADSVLNSDKSVEVRLKLTENRELAYRCLRQYYGQFDPNSLNCALQQ